MSFIPEVRVAKSEDRLTVWIRQKYHPRGLKYKTAFRWRLAGVWSLKELAEEEKA